MVGSGGAGGARRVWVDTDVALGSPRGDVDDGFALAALFGAARTGAIELLGVSTVTGNARATEAASCAARIAEASEVEVRIVAGADRPGDGAGAGHALARLPDGCAVVALGPLSNLARAIGTDPTLPDRVSLAVVGGNLFSRGLFPPVWPHEFNFAHDRSSARRVFAASWRRLVVFPLDVVRRLRCDAERLERIRSAGGAGAHLALGSRRWLARSRWRRGRGGFPVWDLPPALAAIGSLAVAVEPVEFPAAQRRYAGIPARCLAATGFDAEEAWRAFDRALV